MFATSSGQAWKHLPAWQQAWETQGSHSHGHISGALTHIIILMFNSEFLKEQLNWKQITNLLNQ